MKTSLLIAIFAMATMNVSANIVVNNTGTNGTYTVDRWGAEKKVDFISQEQAMHIEKFKSNSPLAIF